MGTCVLRRSGEKLLDAKRDFARCSKRCSPAEESPDLVAPVRSGMNSERLCCSTDFGNRRVLMESSLQCSLPLAHVRNRAVSRRAGLACPSLRFENVR
jgi:hypothetical protein